MFVINRKQGKQITQQVFLILCLLATVSCNVTRSVPDDRYLLNNVKIKIDKKALASELKPIIKQKPNRKILGISRFYLNVYTLADRGKESKFKKWLKKTVGEPPVLYDQVLTQKSSEQLKIYLQNIGYFNASVTDSVILKKKKAEVTYYVLSQTPYKIKSFDYFITDSTIKKIVMRDILFSELKKDEHYNVKTFEKERDRITKILNDSGYYDFTSEYIRFWVDSSNNNHTVNLKLEIENPSLDETDTNRMDLYHQQYYMNNIYVHSTYQPLSADTSTKDDTLLVKNYFFIKKNVVRNVRPEIILEQIFFKKGERYNRRQHQFSYQRLQDLTVFRYINFTYKEAGVDSLGRKLLDCNIFLTPGINQNYAIENELTNNGGALGIAGNIVYRNKNTFSGAEMMQIKLRGSAEALTNYISDSTSNEKEFLFFNTYEIGPEVSFLIPKFLIPLKILNEPKRYNPGTIFNTNLLYEFNPDYKRSTFNFNFGYTWKSSRFFRHYVYPAEINYFKVSLSDEFAQKLLDEGNLALISSFRDHMIANARYTVLFNSQNVRKPGNFFFIRNSFEMAGNLFYLFDKNTNNNTDEVTDTYTKLGVPYAQYVKDDLDIRYYQIFSKHTQLVYRVYGGLGIAYGNSKIEGGTILPFEKSFFTGGANDLRAYMSRTVGPGSFVSEDNYEKFGDIKLNFNIEYRFDVIKVLQGALFFDAGNVWFRNDVDGYEGGKFEANTFYKEIASGAGIGIRFNFNFFILRLDGALPVTDPSYPSGKRYVLNKSQLDDINFNFGIGYPF